MPAVNAWSMQWLKVGGLVGYTRQLQLEATCEVLVLASVLNTVWCGLCGDGWFKLCTMISQISQRTCSQPLASVRASMHPFCYRLVRAFWICQRDNLQWVFTCKNTKFILFCHTVWIKRARWCLVRNQLVLHRSWNVFLNVFRSPKSEKERACPHRSSPLTSPWVQSVRLGPGEAA